MITFKKHNPEGISTNVSINPKHIVDKLFSNNEFRQEYEEYKEDIQSSLDRQFFEGNMSALKYFRIKKKITQSNLANIIGVSQPQIARWENKKRLNIRDNNMLLKLADVLEINVEELIRDPSSR